MTPADINTMVAAIGAFCIGAGLVAMLATLYPRRIFVVHDLRMYRDLLADGHDVEFLTPSEFVESLRDEYARRHGVPHPDRARYGLPAIRSGAEQN